MPFFNEINIHIFCKTKTYGFIWNFDQKKNQKIELAHVAQT